MDIRWSSWPVKGLVSDSRQQMPKVDVSRLKVNHSERELYKENGK